MGSRRDTIPSDPVTTDSQPKRSSRVDLAAQLLLAVLALLPFHRALFGPDCLLSFDTRLHPPMVVNATPDLATRPANFVTSDLNGWILPETVAALAQLRAGEIPLWNPDSLCGQPLLANLAFPAFYPPNWLFLVLDPLRAVGWFVALHLALAGILAYRFLRGHDLLASAALFGAAAVEFAPFLTTRAHLPMILATCAWFFGILRGVDRVLAAPRARAGGWLAITIGMAALAGFPQMLAFSLLGAGAYAAVRLPERARERRFADAAALLVSVALGIAIGAIHLFPAVELLGDSVRGQPRAPDVAVDRGLDSATFLAILLPDLFGHPVEREGIPTAVEQYLPQREWLSAGIQQNPVENTLWPGGGVLTLLLTTGILALGARGGRALLLVALLGLVLATRSPLLEALHRTLPVLASAGPKRALMLFTLALPALAAFGVDRWIGTEQPMRGLRRGALALGVSILAFALFARWAPTSWFDASRVERSELEAFGRYTLERAWLLLPVPLAFLMSWRIGACVAILELIVAAHSFNPTQPIVGQYPRTPALEFLAKDGERSVRFGDHTLASASYGPMFGYSCFDGMEPMVLTRSAELVESIEPGRFDPSDPRVMRAFQDPASLSHPAFLRGACPNVVANRLIDGLELVYRGDAEQLAVFRQPLALPRVRLVPEFEIIADKDQRLARLADRTLDPRRTVILEQSPTVTDLVGPASGERVAAVARASVTIEVAAAAHVSLALHDLEAPAFLVLADSYDDDWIVEVDGKMQPLLIADHAFRAVALHANARRVDFRYAPRSFIVGAIASALALLAALITLLRFKAATPPGSLAVAS